jgi:hypothetical protein
MRCNVLIIFPTKVATSNKPGGFLLSIGLEKVAVCTQSLRSGLRCSLLEYSSRKGPAMRRAHTNSQSHLINNGVGDSWYECSSQLFRRKWLIVALRASGQKKTIKNSFSSTRENGK